MQHSMKSQSASTRIPKSRLPTPIPTGSPSVSVTLASMPAKLTAITHPYWSNTGLPLVPPVASKLYCTSTYSASPDTPDVGVFFLDDNLSGEEEVLSLIPREHVDGLRIGQPVATLGFPGELKFTGGDADNTVNATFKDGTISALRIQGSGDAEYVEVQYNFNTTGGTSGSPVFDQYGWVIAVHFSNIVARVTDPDGDPVGIGVGSLNFGMRVDALWDFIRMLISTLLLTRCRLRVMADDTHCTSAPTPFTRDTQPFPENLEPSRDGSHRICDRKCYRSIAWIAVVLLDGPCGPPGKSLVGPPGGILDRA